MGNKELTKINKIDYLISYIKNFLKENNQDIDEYYYDLLEQALEYGMTPNQFWNDEIELFYCYQNAYMRRLHNQCHIQGLYNSIAFGVVVGNALKKSTSQSLEYPKENLLDTNINSIKNELLYERTTHKKAIISKERITKDNLEEQYRLRLMNSY